MKTVVPPAGSSSRHLSEEKATENLSDTESLIQILLADHHTPNTPVVSLTMSVVHCSHDAHTHSAQGLPPSLDQTCSEEENTTLRKMQPVFHMSVTCG